MTDQSGFDVFLCHNSEDKAEVRQVAEQLKRQSIRVWLDEWELRPGVLWQRELERQILHIHSVAVFVGKSSIGPWQQQEIDAFLRKFVERDCPVIPVLLPSSPEQPELPLFLQGFMWVDFRKPQPEPLKQLVWGITGQKPGVEISQLETSVDDLAEISSITENVVISSPSQELQFAKLQTLLAEGRWREADQETKCLILNTSGGDLLKARDIRHLPGDLLRQIDSLWVEHSSGRFGLSIQQRIWKRAFEKSFLKRIFNKKQEISETEAWNHFRKQVGWWTDDAQWFSYEKLDFSLNSPEGCFPYSRAWLNQGWNKATAQFASLMTQVENCNRT